ncbi:MAG TPA: hypothetical protein VFS60_13150 [Thermoanaerobaculia bacterium]|nr:hypothetical protein [Thermoanaerobaculia bacterium]
MSSAELENLVRIGSLRPEPPSRPEIDGLVSTAEQRLADARNPANSLASRFDLAYNAAHAVCLAALRRRGYRSDQRYVVFQTIAHTLGLHDAVRVLELAHRKRNRSEYHGVIDYNESLVADLIVTAERALTALRGALTKD